MGYSTYFTGAFKLSRKLTVTERETVEALRDPDYDHPKMPDSECTWRLQPDADVLEDIGEEKLYNWDDWLVYLCQEVFEPMGVKVNGRVYWHGEDVGDAGVIFVKDNDVRLRNINEMPEPDWSQPEPESDGPSPGASPLQLLQGN